MKKALLQVHLSVLLAGLTGPLGKMIHLSAEVLVWYRMLIAALTLVIWGWLKKDLTLLPFRKILLISMVGFMVALNWVAFFASIKFSNVSIAVVCISTSALFSAILEPLIFKKNMDWLEVFFSMISIGGIVIIFHFDQHYRIGIYLGLTAAFLSALFIMFMKKLVGNYTPQMVTTYVLGTGFLWLTLLMPFYLYFLPAQQLIPNWHDGILLLILGWLCTVWAFRLSISALKKVSSFTVNLSYNLEPVYSIILAFILFQENKELGPWFYAGLGMILLSVLLQLLNMGWKNHSISLKKTFQNSG
ncbi:MAG: DMT family transporter [Chitinophagaceae bacterium]